jgi:hypothetical protein
MCRAAAAVLAVLGVHLHGVRAGADPSKPHAHQGRLGKFEMKPPNAIGLDLRGITDDDLRQGHPVVRMMPAPGGGGFERAVSMQDVHAPEAMIWDFIMDLRNYPKYVEGVMRCDVYSDSSSRSERTVCSTYKVGAMGFGVTYYMKHIFDPKKHCMTFHLDYDRCSELDDTVGYW